MEDPHPPLASLRRRYTLSGIDESHLPEDPLALFRTWLGEAVRAGLEEPNAMTLATTDPEGHPSARTVLLKGMEEDGFGFFTNYSSRKARELAANPHAALVFFWKELERQVCVRGVVGPTSREDAERYFRLRPYESQIGAWVSTQSEIIPSRAWIEDRDRDFRQRFPEGQVPLPDFWGGYRLIPTAIEFWQGRPGRLHDRILYQRPDLAAQAWNRCRLSP